MASEPAKNPTEVIIKQLADQARAHWGDERAAGLGSLIEQTAEQIEFLRLNLPQAETEPGFYQ